MRVDDRVGLDELGDLPGEQQVRHLRVVGLRLADDLEPLVERLVRVLHQHAAVDVLEIEARRRRVPLAAAQQADVLLGRDRVARRGVDLGRDDDFDELLFDDDARGVAVERAVEGDDAAKGRLRIGAVGAPVGVEQAVAERDAAGVGVLDDHAGRRVELLDALERGVGVGDVVERQRLALQLLGGRDARLGGIALDVEGRRLVRVLAVTHRLRVAKLQVQRARECPLGFGLHEAAEIVGDCTVVVRGVLEGLDREREARRVADAAGGFEFVEQPRIVGGVDDDGDRGVVLGRGAHHRRAADVDVLDRILEAAIGIGDGLLERVEVDDDQVDRLDAVLAHHRVVFAAAPEDAAVDFRMQCLDAAGHHLREAGVVGNLGDLDAVVGEQPRGAAGG